MGYTLGIDVGVASLGTAVVYTDENGKPVGKPKLYVRIFPNVTGSTVKTLSTGKDKAEDANNFKRRGKRLQRRQIDRRRRRAVRLFHQLQDANFLPLGESKTPLQRDAIIKEFDNAHLAQLLDEIKSYPNIKNRNVPYILRALALERELQPFELGRVLYHLVQRRGFKSNRKVKEGTATKEDEETGKVKSSIKELQKELGGLTLGQFFAGINSDKNGRLLRNRNLNKSEKRTETAKLYAPHYTSRALYEDEFNRIWKFQLQFYGTGENSKLNLPFRREIYHTLFYQRPLKSQAGRIGYCELEPKRRRASAACLEFQRFRYWQKINDLRLYLPTGEERPLTEKEKEKLAALCEYGQCSWTEIKEHFGWKAPKGLKFFCNLQKQKEDKLIENKTAVAIRKVWDGWDSFDDSQQSQLVEMLLADSQESKIAKRLVETFQLDKDTAKKLAAVSVSSDYASYSLTALRKILPELQAGNDLYTALDTCYPDRNNPKEILDKLPKVKDILPYIANPSVERSLTELRKVVNAIIQQEGEKPQFIRIELARILKSGRKKREAAHDRMIEQRKKREAAKKKLLAQDFWSYGEPKRADIDKWMLLEECKCKDPYSGDQISPGDLFGMNPRFDVEHIYPKSLTGDSSFSNLTLCRKDYNLHKGNRTPKAAFGDTAEYQEMLVRIKSFNKNKAERFQQDNVPPEFQNRMLNDTSYIATAAVKYLAMLYGGVIEKGIHHDKNVQRIFVVPGQATARLRRIWGLNGILGPNALKNPDLLDELKTYEETESEKPSEWKKYRADHRHHAIDGFVIANCTPDIIKRWATEEEKRDFARINNDERYPLDVPSPYGDCFSVVKEVVGAIIVSHRGDRRISGALHKDSNYKETDKDWNLQIGKKKKEQGFIREEYRVKSDSNHHIEIVADIDENGNEISWEGIVVPLIEAKERHNEGKPVIQTNHGEKKIFKFSLSLNDYIIMPDSDGKRQCYIIRVISKDAHGYSSVSTKHHTDARTSTEILKTKGLIHMATTLKEKQVQKVEIDVLGNIHSVPD